MDADALALAARQDAELKSGNAERGPLWGVPIVIKANTSIAGKVTTDGWSGFTMPGHELVAPRDATVVAKLKAAGAIIIGHTNMPDFANSDTNRSSSFGRTGNAYDVRFSPGGSSGGTVTAVAANMAVLGTGTDTGNSIRMPAATSASIGVYPTRGLVSTAGIAPLDWLLDNTGPIARNVDRRGDCPLGDGGPDPLDARTEGSAASAQPGPYTQYLKAGCAERQALRRALVHSGGIRHPVPRPPRRHPGKRRSQTAAGRGHSASTRDPGSVHEGAGSAAEPRATVVIDDTILPESFARTASRVGTYPYVRQGTELFLKEFGPAEYKTPADYLKAVGAPLFPSSSATTTTSRHLGDLAIQHRRLDTRSRRRAQLSRPARATLEAYLEALDRLQLDGYVYPAIQMPPPDETMPQDGGISGGPHSATSWVNMIGVPAVVVVGGHYPGGLPFGLEFSTRPWKDGDLLALRVRVGAGDALPPSAGIGGAGPAAEGAVAYAPTVATTRREVSEWRLNAVG